MSNYRSSRTTLNASVVSAYELASSEYGALLHGMCSMDVAALAGDLPNLALAESPAALCAWSQIDQAMPGWRSYLPLGSVETLSAAQAGSIPLSAAVTSVAQDLATLERLAATDAFVRALPVLGYQIERVDGEHTSAVEARRGHDTFLLVAYDQGRLEMDHLLLADASCTDIQREIIEEVRREGLELTDEVLVQHHDPRGGSLVAYARRAGGPSLAAGAVAAGDTRPSALVTSLLPTAAPSRARAIEGDPR